MVDFNTFCHLAKRAVNIMQTLGTRSAAGYLRNRGLPINSALTLLGFEVRHPELSFADPLPKGVLESQLAKLTLAPKA